MTFFFVNFAASLLQHHFWTKYSLILFQLNCLELISADVTYEEGEEILMDVVRTINSGSKV